MKIEGAHPEIKSHGTRCRCSLGSVAPPRHVDQRPRLAYLARELQAIAQTGLVQSRPLRPPAEAVGLAARMLAAGSDAPAKDRGAICR
jgi:hypothetical protein